MHRRGLLDLHPELVTALPDDADGGSGSGGDEGKGEDGGPGDSSGTEEGKGGDDGGSGDDASKGKDAGDGEDKGKPKGGDDTFSRRYVEKLRDDVVKERKKVEKFQEDFTKGLRKLLGDDADEQETDPAKLAASAVKERDDARGEAAGLRRELAVFRAAGGLGVDGDRLLDSRSFERELAGLDPADGKFADKVAKMITAAAEKDPALKLGRKTPPPQGGADMSGEGGKNTDDDASSTSAIDKAREKRRERRTG